VLLKESKSWLLFDISSSTFEIWEGDILPHMAMQS